MLSNYDEVSRTHDLTLLTRMLERAGLSLDERFWECAEFLELFSVQIRHLGDMDVSKRDAEQALEPARVTQMYLKTFLSK